MAEDQPSESATAESGGMEVIGERLDAVEDSVAALRADLDEKIDDVRGRVVQVKREVDGKAPADHDHPELEARIESAAGEPDAGIGEGEFEDLLETSRDLERKLERLARVTVDLHETVDRLAAAEAEEAAVAELARSANAHGARDADCGNCGETVDIGLLTEPRCPHCAEPFQEFVPKRWVFGSHVLEVGDHPALEPADGAEEDGLDAVLDAGSESPPAGEDRATADGSGESPDGNGG